MIDIFIYLFYLKYYNFQLNYIPKLNCELFLKN